MFKKHSFKMSFWFFLFILIFSGVALAQDEWWNASWHYRLEVNVSSGGYERNDTPVELVINFTQYLDGKTFDNNSVRVIEYSNGQVIGEVASQLDINESYNAVNNAIGEVVWIMNGTTPPNTTRKYYIYFDSIDYEKVPPDYYTNLTYITYGDEIHINTSKLEIKIDTDRYENSSGIYFVRRKDSGITIFDIPETQNTLEYVKYYNGTQDLGFDFANNFSFIGGAVRLVMEQVGDEMVWGNPNQKTNKGRMIKRYTFYMSSEWVKIEQIFRNIGTEDINRSSNGITALALDAARGFTMADTLNSITDPYSWASVHDGVNKGLGVINVREENTNNYYSDIDPVSEGRLGVKLLKTTINSDSEISETAVVYFNDKADHTPVTDLRDRLQNPVSLNVGSLEQWGVVISAGSDFSIYNRGENALITGTVLNDTNNLIYSMNVTLNMGTSNTDDDVTIKLFDDGTHGDLIAGDNIYTNNYTFPEYSVVGSWNLTVKAYSSDGYLLNWSVKTIDIVNNYNINLTILNPNGITERVVFANLTIRNYRNDSGIIDAIVNCSYNSTDVSNISDKGDGNYSINFTAPQIAGTWTLSCDVEKNNNTGSGFDSFFTEEGKTFLDVVIKVDRESIDNITLTNGVNISVNVSVNNVGNGTGYYTSVELIIPSNWVSNPNFVECGNISIGGSCIKYFNISVPANTSPGSYNVTVVVNWTNPDGSINFTENVSVIIVESNPVLEVVEDYMLGEVDEGTMKAIGNFTINSTGNDMLRNITFTCISGAVCNNFTVLFEPEGISELINGNIYVVIVNVSIPEGFRAGNYTGVINVSSNSSWDILDINITVPESYTWLMSPMNCSDSVLVNRSGILCTIVVNNTGNVILNFTIHPPSGNFTEVDKTELNISSCSFDEFNVIYNTSNAETGMYSINYTLTPNKGIERNLSVKIEVVLGPTITSETQEYGEQIEAIEIRLKVIDLSLSGIDHVNVSIKRPDGYIDRFNLTNITANTPGATSYWAFNYTNTSRRGVYILNFTAFDNQGGFSSTWDNFTIYSTLNTTLRTTWPDYYAGDVLSINYNVTDGVGVGLKVNVSIVVRSPYNMVLFNKTYMTSENGEINMVPIFSIPTDSLEGIYLIEAYTTYFDELANVTVNSTTSYNFTVYQPITVELETSVVTYPGNVLKIYMMLYGGSGILGEYNMTLTVYDTVENVLFTANKDDMDVINQTNSSVLYVFEYPLPSDIPTGVYLAVLDVQQGMKHRMKMKSFRISSGGPYDLIISYIESEVEQGSYLDFDITIQNMGDVSQDVYLDYWIADEQNNIYDSVSGEAVFVAANDTRTISRQLFIYSTQNVGVYYLNVKMRYSVLQPDIQVNRSFVVVEKNVTENVTLQPIGVGGPSITAKVIEEKPTEVYRISIANIYPEKLEVERGGIRYVTIEVKNKGNMNIEDVFVDIDGIPSTWFKRIGRISSISAGESAFQIIKFKIPDDAEIKTYNIKIKVSTLRAEDGREYKIIVYKTKEDLVKAMLEGTRELLKEIETRTAQASLERNVTEVLRLIEEVNYLLDEAEGMIKVKNFVKAIVKIEDARNLLQKADYLLAKRERKMVILFPIHQLTWLFIVIFVIALILKFYPKDKSVDLRAIKERVLEKRLPEVKPKIEKGDIKEIIRKKRSEIIELIKTLDEQYEKGMITREAYIELKEKYKKEAENITVRTCKSCGFFNDGDYRFCIKCGTELKTKG